MNATEPGAIGETGAAHQLVTSGQVLAGYFIAVFSVVSVVFSFLLPAEMGGDTAYIAQNSIACVIGLIIGASLIRGVVGAVSWAKLLLVFGMIIALFQAVAGGAWNPTFISLGLLWGASVTDIWERVQNKKNNSLSARYSLWRYVCNGVYRLAH